VALQEVDLLANELDRWIREMEKIESEAGC